MDILSFVLGYNKGKAQSSNSGGNDDSGTGGGATITDIFPLQTVDGFILDTNDLPGTYYTPTLFDFVINEGDNYCVEWEGVTYNCKGTAISLGEFSGIYLGNAAGVGFAGNDEPFVIFDTGNGVQFIALEAGESHSIRIYQANSIKVKPLVATANGVYTAPEGEAYSPVTVSVASGGVVDFPYDLEEILSPIDLSFKFGESWAMPSTPCAVLADGNGAASMIENKKVILSGESGLVIWDRDLYAVYSGDRISPTITDLNGNTLAVNAFGVLNSVGNIAMPSIFQITKNAQPVKFLNSNGRSNEPFYIVANKDWGYVFASDEKPDFMYAQNIGAISQAHTAKYVEKLYSQKAITPNAIYHVKWDDVVYTCRAAEDVIIDIVDEETTIETPVVYLGNGKALGQTNTGEPFTIISTVEDNTMTCAFYDTDVPVGDYIGHTFSIYTDKERKHTVQIFRFTNTNIEEGGES